MPDQIDNTYGIWQVSRAVDERSESLGVWEGYLDQIALHLADKAGYGLEFKPITIQAPGRPTGDFVDVNLMDLLGRKKTGEEQRQAAKNFLTGRPVAVQEGKYQDVRIVDSNGTLRKEQLEAVELRRQAYATLTPAQLRALGLPADESNFDPK